ncbi:NADH-quinone oxidoreductase subunit C [Dissulfurirhabdus thermomarina]|uniref:NADH-quinone oxidoreductase subunit C n=1 Tax=Dissulfurirhabdus thermomarina TaxID=1765737 RepID=A0A6N9TJQ2_DISTH|nr:NADH-quinone oxidoreductase subunit C [Dissulfurirhabdus thermomarina]NDY41475.1 NADH-quinone oxidoreductase subunit C [Dissulfurirhabdus thermomarina]NMX24243.1 NADH-quinone oxidoreductase subunit C [Dissulfurirhabdus thermomarina]
MSLKDQVTSVLGELAVQAGEFRGDLTVEVPRERIVEALRRLRDAPELGFDFLSDVVGVDAGLYHENKAKAAAKKKPAEGGEAPAAAAPAETPPRFEVIYLLLSLKSNRRVRVKVRVPEDDPVVDSVTGLWKAADWPEREIFDMFGVRFAGHPNLKRLLMWEEFPAHPLRKDYPLEGRGEERHLSYE